MQQFLKRITAFIAALLLLSLFPAAVSGQVIITGQVQHTISISPTTGPVGTIVTITDVSGTNLNKTCFATVGSALVTIGTMAGSLTFAIPTMAQLGSVIPFVCTGGTDGARSNTVNFTVATPGSIDTDNDGVPDSSDNCPTVPGVPENAGCPLAPSRTPITLPDLPTTGACVLATLEANTVNIRQTPSTDAPIVGQLDPLQIYSVIGRNANSSWWQINGGWVAGFVTRRGGDCNAVPQTDGGIDDLAIEEPQEAIGLLIPAIQKAPNVQDELENCPQLFPTVDGLPTFLTLYIIGEDNPCAAAQTQLDDLFLGGGAGGPPQAMTDLEDAIIDWILAVCPDSFGYIYDFFSLLNRINNRSPEAWGSVASNLNEDTICPVIEAFGGRTLSPLAFFPEYLPVSAAAYCVAEAYNQMTTGWFNRTVGYLNFLQVPTESIRVLVNFGGTGTCNLIEYIRTVGVISTGNALFYATLANFCSQAPAIGAQRAIYDAIRGAYDAEAASNQGCVGMNQLESFPLPADLQPTMPNIAQDAECRGNFRLLATHNAVISPESLFRILTSLTPCDNAFEMAYYGSFVTGNNLPLPQCFQNGQVIISSPSLGSEDVVITNQSSWRQKLLIIDRPLNQICDYVNLSPGGGLGLALEPTVDQLDLVAVPTDTPLGFVALATNTPPIFVAPATDTPLGFAALATNTPALGEPPLEEPPVEPPAEEPPAEQPSGQEQVSGDGNPTEEVAFYYNRIAFQYAMTADGANGSFDGIYFVPAARHRMFSIVDRTNLQRLPDDCCTGLNPNYPVSLLPNGEGFAYFANGSDPATLDQPRTLNYWVFGTEAPQSIPLVEGFTPTSDPPAWSPDGSSVLISMMNTAGVRYIMFHDIGEPVSGEPAYPTYFAIENAQAPSISPNQRMIAFERIDPTGRNIYVMAVNSGQITPITQQSAGSECYSAEFGLDSLTLFFTCQEGETRNIFRYGLAGIAQLQTGIQNAQNPAPGPEVGYITFDDGQTIYMSRDDGSNPAPFAQIEGLNLHNLHPAVPESQLGQQLQLALQEANN